MVKQKKVEKQEVPAEVSIAKLATIHQSLAQQAPSPELLEVIADHQRTFEAWLQSVPPEEDLDTDSELYEPFARAEGLLFEIPCRSYADVIAKSQYIFARETEAAHSAFDAISQHAVEFLNSILGNDPMAKPKRPPKKKANPVTEPKVKKQYLTVRDIPPELITDEIRSAQAVQRRLADEFLAAGDHTYDLIKPILDRLNSSETSSGEVTASSVH